MPYPPEVGLFDFLNVPHLPIDYFTINDSRDGLFLCSGCESPRRFYVCNPITKQFKIIYVPYDEYDAAGAVDVSVSLAFDGCEFDVPEMTSDYSGWSLRYHVNLQSMRQVFPELTDTHFGFSVVTMIKDGIEEEELMAVIVVDHKDIPYRAISYDLHDGIATKICDLQPTRWNRRMKISKQNLVGNRKPIHSLNCLLLPPPILTITPSYMCIYK
ncbi:unnamed protein product [Dovyalis caffra]|uniref:Uncharacterized protein n=1 Tax=Dovyalis caffra TaxID=77055 RepID=A0AAV1RZR1_9ROSI|nr:unnamed protein product [Dovyalis caffra]